MNDPRRLRDDDPVAAALFGAARGFRASPAARRRTRRALGLPAALSLLGWLGASATAASSGGALKAVVLASAVAASGVGGFAVHREIQRSVDRQIQRSVAHAPAPIVPRAIGAAPIGAPPAAAEATEPPAISAAPVVATAEPPRETVARTRVRAQPAHAPSAQPAAAPAPPPATEPPPAAPTIPSPSPPPASAPAASVAAEVRLLADAREALRRGDARAALRHTDAHARRFPAGILRAEAEVLRIEALARAGHTAEARARAASFLRMHPRSVLTARVAALAAEIERTKEKP